MFGHTRYFPQDFFFILPNTFIIPRCVVFSGLKAIGYYDIYSMGPSPFKNFHLWYKSKNGSQSENLISLSGFGTGFPLVLWPFMNPTLLMRCCSFKFHLHGLLLFNLMDLQEICKYHFSDIASYSVCYRAGQHLDKNEVMHREHDGAKLDRD